MSWFESMKNPKLKNAKKVSDGRVSATPDGVWQKCSRCGEILQTAKLKENQDVCPYCEHHYPMSVDDRIRSLLDNGVPETELFTGLSSRDPLRFEDKRPYTQRLREARLKTHNEESVVCVEGKVDGIPVVLTVMDFRFMGGSMGVVAGEKIARAMEHAATIRRPLILVSCTGGARMQEGILSLMQMAKTAAARHRLKEARIPYISVLADPTTGGCAASFAMLGDIHIAEPDALIGFAGPRVIGQTIRQTMPEGFQRSEFLQERGFVDRIVHRHELKREIHFFLQCLTP